MTDPKMVTIRGRYLMQGARDFLVGPWTGPEIQWVVEQRLHWDEETFPPEHLIRRLQRSKG